MDLLDILMLIAERKRNVINLTFDGMFSKENSVYYIHNLQ